MKYAIPTDTRHLSNSFLSRPFITASMEECVLYFFPDYWDAVKMHFFQDHCLKTRDKHSMEVFLCAILLSRPL